MRDDSPRVLDVSIRDEIAADVGEIGDTVRAAFAGTEHSSGTEQDIVAALRDAGALTESLVAECDDEIVGHVAASSVRLEPGAPGKWFGIGPLSVRPDLQNKGIGAALMENVLERLEARGARGAVLLGDPEYYRRFGFGLAAPLRFADAPADYFQARFLGASAGDGREFPASDVIYDDAFGARTEGAVREADEVNGEEKGDCASGGCESASAGWAETTSVMSWRSRMSVLSFGSMFSSASLLSFASAGSILSIGSVGSILSIGSSGSILSIGSAGSILSIGGAGRFRNRHGEEK